MQKPVHQVQIQCDTCGVVVIDDQPTGDPEGTVVPYGWTSVAKAPTVGPVEITHHCPRHRVLALPAVASDEAESDAETIRRLRAALDDASEHKILLYDLMCVIRRIFGGPKGSEGPRSGGNFAERCEKMWIRMRQQCDWPGQKAAGRIVERAPGDEEAPPC